MMYYIEAEIIFLICFTLHNIEEAVWLPEWSKYAGRFHPQTGKNEFKFAVTVVTLSGYLITYAFWKWGSSNEIIRYLYLGFVMMMCFNAVFPHLTAAVVLKKYAPGLLTGIFLNLPVGLYVVFFSNPEHLELHKLILGFAVYSGATLLSLRPLFKIGRKFFS